MKEIFLEYQKIPYLYDLESSKVFRIDGLDLIEINNHEFLQGLRLKATEISFRCVQQMSLASIH